RYDLHTEINGTISPRVALIYRFAPDHTVRLGGSVGYRPPTLIETNLDVRTVVTVPTGFPPPFNTFTSIIPTAGSHNLDPEQINSYELEYQGWYLKHRLRLRGSLFFNHITNLITFRQVGPVATAVNGSEADIYGGEVGAEFLVTTWLSGFANYSYQEIGQSFVGEQRRGGPRSKVNLGLRGEWENGLSAEATYHYYGSATYPISSAFSDFAAFGVPPVDPRVGSYNLLNLRGAYRFWQQKAAAGYLREAEAAVSVFNALNDRHKEHPLGEVIGSRVLGWLTVRF
ncbi:MAG: TonB-dependent receptor plug domain-containing protein, partial [Nitrospiraceae bacterium]